jgi:hypothetical protein
VDTKGNVTAVGFGMNSVSEGNIWTVRQSRDGGGTWATIDSISGRAFGVTTVPRPDGLPDDLYVTGDQNEVSNTSSPTYWHVRKLTASLAVQGAITWTAVDLDDLQLFSGQTASAQGGAVYDSGSDSLIVTGVATDGAAWHWITRSAALP